MDHKQAVLNQKEAERRQLASMRGHRPGLKVTLSDGTRYEVQATGAWLRVSEKSTKRSRQVQR